MITHVKHLIEALERFNPDAKLKSELMVDGVSPSVECAVDFAHGSRAEINELTKEYKELDKRTDELYKAGSAIRNLCEQDKLTKESVYEILNAVNVI